MLIEILKDVFDDGVNDRALDRLWYTIEDRHKLLLRGNEEVLMESTWFNSQRPSIQELLFELMKWSIQTPSSVKSEIQISIKDNENYFSIREAERYLIQPFIIILENSKNDGYFMNALFKNFQKYGKEIIAHKKEGWVEYRLGGGTTIKDVIQTKFSDYDDDIFVKEKHRYLRCFVLMDSDRNFPEKNLSSEKQSVIKFLEENNIPYHILEKREIENYLPDETIDSIPDNRAFIDAYLRLNPIQKDYFDLEKGFVKTKFKKLPDKTQVLYVDVDTEDVKVFEKHNLLKKYKEQGQSFKSEFPKLFYHKTVTKKSLLNRCKHHSNTPSESPYNPNELPDLVEKIAKLL